MNSLYNLHIDWNAPIEANISFIDKCITDCKNRKQYLLKLKKERDEKLNNNQINLIDAINEANVSNNQANSNEHTLEPDKNNE